MNSARDALIIAILIWGIASAQAEPASFTGLLTGPEVRIADIDYSGAVVGITRFEGLVPPPNIEGDVVWRLNDTAITLPASWGKLQILSGDGVTFGLYDAHILGVVRLATSATSVQVLPYLETEFGFQLELGGTGDLLGLAQGWTGDTNLWTPTTGYTVLDPAGRVQNVSEDGLVLVGRSCTGADCGSHRYSAARWTRATPEGPITREFIADNFNTQFSQATAVSPNGEHVVGEYDVPGLPPGVERGFVWTEATGADRILTGFSGEEAVVSTGGISDTGRAVGSLRPFPSDEHDISVYTAVFWDADGAPERVLDRLIADGLGAELAGWTLHTADRISRDGLVLAGVGTNPEGMRQTWRARLSVPVPEPSSFILVMAASLFTRYRPLTVRSLLR